MFEPIRKPTGKISSALATLELIYHSVVRSLRKQHNNAFLAMAINLMQVVMFMLAFYIMFSMLGLRRAAVRGDFLLYLLSGIFLYMTHVKALGAVAGSEGPASAMLQHAPLTTFISTASSALSVFYIQLLSVLIILFIYHVAVTPVQIEQPIASFGMFAIAWFTGCAVGVVMLALKPWFPTFVSLFTMFYQRANMIASGKMFLANTLPSSKISMFDWNPLFHIIDQSRGFVFINYNPRYTDWEYAIWVGLAILTIGMMGEFYTRKHASVSWYARR